MQKNQDPKDEIKSLLRPFRDRQTDIVAYRGNVCNQKGSYRVHWTIRKTACKKAFLGTDK